MGVQPASAQITREIAGTIVFSTATLEGSNPGDPTFCGVVPMLVFDDVPGATYYKLPYTDAWRPGRTFYVTGPPFPGDAAFTYVGLHPAVGRGQHRKGLAGLSGPRGCGYGISVYEGRFTPLPGEVHFPSEPPEAAFTYTVDGALTVSFDGSASTDADGTIVSYDWDFGDGSFGSGVTTSHTYAEGGIYSVKLTVTNDQGLGDVERQTVDLRPAKMTYTLTADPAEVEPGESFSLTVTVENVGEEVLTDVGPVSAPAMTSTDGAEVSLNGGPEPAGPVALAPGASQDFVYRYEGTAEGTARFKADVQGKDPGGETVTARFTCDAGADEPFCGEVTITKRVLVVNSVDNDRKDPSKDGCDTGQDIDRDGTPEPECTLNAAAEVANDRPGVDEIHFDIPGVTGVPVIGENFGFTFEEGVIIDGTTQPGAGRVALQGPGGNGIIGLNLQRSCQNYPFIQDEVGLHFLAGAGGSEVRGLSVYSYGGAGILIDEGAMGVLIEDNNIGTNDGTDAQGNGVSCVGHWHGVPFDYIGGGLVVRSSGNRIAGNTIFGNKTVVPIASGSLSDTFGIGLRIEGGSNNDVQGNTFVGTSQGQTINVLIDRGSGNRIGGAGEGNDIFGAPQADVHINGASATGNLLRGNRIGHLGSNSGGVHVIDAPANEIGGAAAGAGNVIGGGVRLLRADRTRVVGNFIGTEADGETALTNSGDPTGTVFSLHATNQAVITNNVVAFGASRGLSVQSGSSDNLIAENRIHSNGKAGGSGEGILMDGNGTGNTLRRNRIFDNGGLGIDLGGDGVTRNDNGDWDAGPNNLQNFPKLLLAYNDGTHTIIKGGLSTSLGAGGTYTVELFTNSTCDALGGRLAFGEGEHVLAFVEVTLDLSGSAPLDLKLAMPPEGHGFVTLTATAPDGSTSEFSKCVRIWEGESGLEVLLGTAEAGDTEIEVDSPDAAKHRTGSASFRIGDRIIICPDCPNEEINTVVGYGSLLLKEPLQFDHAAGEVVLPLEADGARAEVLDALARAELLRAHPEKKVHHRAEKAHERLQKSLEKGWLGDDHLDEKDGKKVFDELKKAAHELEKLLGEKEADAAAQAEARAALDHLLAAAERLAMLARAAAESTCEATADDKDRDKCRKELEKAQKEWDKAEEELAREKYDKAIDKYGKAWEKAQKAMEKAAGKNGEVDEADAVAEVTEEVPSTYVLEANYPNPFNPQTVIGYALPEASPVRLVVYDALGREIAVLVDGEQPVGRHAAVFEASRLPSGVYFYRLTAGRFTQVRRMLLVK